MKTTHIALVAGILALFFLASCGGWELAGTSERKASRVSYPGKVYLKDKRVLEGHFRLPHLGSKKITITTQESAKPLTFNSEEVEYMEAWNPNAPEAKRIFLCTPVLGEVYSRKNPSKFRWLTPHKVTPHIIWYYGAATYSIDNNGGVTLMNKINSYSFAQTDYIYYYLQKKGEEYPKLIGSPVYQAGYDFRFEVTNYLSDDPDLVEYIKTNKQ